MERDFKIICIGALLAIFITAIGFPFAIFGNKLFSEDRIINETEDVAAESCADTTCLDTEVAA